MKLLPIFAALILSCSATVASASDAKAYYDQLYDGDRFDVTIALGFEQKKGDADLPPVIKDVADALKAPFRDNENTKQDVDVLEISIRECDSCNYSKISSGLGSRIYAGSFKYGTRTIHSRLQLVFSEPGVSISQLRKTFVSALATDAVVMYLGHSRHGDGFPDFAGPLGDDGKLFVNDPVQGWTGFEKGYFSRKKYQILVMNACQTKRYFQQPLRKLIWEKDPASLGLILSADDTWFDDYAATTLAVLEGLIHQQSRAEILQSMNDAANYYHSLHMNDKKKIALFVGDGLFDGTYVKKATPKPKQPAEPWMDMPF